MSKKKKKDITDVRIEGYDDYKLFAGEGAVEFGWKSVTFVHRNCTAVCYNLKWLRNRLREHCQSIFTFQILSVSLCFLKPSIQHLLSFYQSFYENKILSSNNYSCEVFQNYFAFSQVGMQSSIIFGHLSSPLQWAYVHMLAFMVTTYMIMHRLKSYDLFMGI